MHNVMNTLVCVPCMALLAIALMDPDVNFYTIVVACFLLGGVGGGAFCSSMASMSFFFPKAKAGTMLGVNGGVANLGVGLGQILFPLLASVPILGLAPISEEAKSPFGGQVWPFQSAWILLGVEVLFAFLAYRYMVTLPMHGTGKLLDNLKGYVALIGMGFLGCGLGVAILLGTASIFVLPGVIIIRVFVLSAFCLFTTLALCYYCTFDAVQKKMKLSMKIFSDKHTHIQTLLYIKTLGSFIGYSMTYPQLIQDTFGYLKDGSVNPAMVGVAAKYAWLGPFCSALARAIGGLGADRYGGANMTHYATCVQITAAIANGVVMILAKKKDNPEDLFGWFMVTYILLMAAAGSGNGSVFKQIAALFEPERRAPVLGWSAAVAAYMAAVFPAVFAAVPQKEILMIIMVSYYIFCGWLNEHYYRGKHAERPC
jgi:NNP family nitrate/nitrite transporter-like MFS transporter